MDKLIEYKPTEQVLFVPNIDEDEFRTPTVTIPADVPGSTTLETPAFNLRERLHELRIAQAQATQAAQTPATTEEVQEYQEADPTKGSMTPIGRKYNFGVAAKAIGTANYQKVIQEHLKENPNDREDLELLTRLAQVESRFDFNEENPKSKAFGAFQLMPFNFRGHTREELAASPRLQVKLALQLLRAQRAAFNKKDYDRAAEIGFSKEDLDIAGWLAGAGGTKNFLHTGYNPSDGAVNITSYLKRVYKGRQGGSLEEGNSLVEIAGKQYYIKIAESEEEKSVGLSNLKELPEDKGMLFIINKDEKDEDGLVWFTMKDTKFPLDIIFLDDDFEVTQVSKGEPLSSEPIYGKGDYVLELNADSGVKIDDELEFVTEKELNKKMMVLDSEGKPQMTLDGGERIFSIKNTKVLIKFAKKASVSNKDNDYKALGKRVFKFLEVQDSTPAEYV